MAFRPELRAFSTLGQPNWLGAYLAVAFFIGIYYLVKYQISNIKNQKYISNIKNFIWPIYLFLNFSMILFSRSRSAIGAVIVGLILFVGYYSFFIKTNFKKILFILLLVTLLPIIFFKTGEDKVDRILNFQFSIFNFQNKSPVTNNNSPISSSNVTESFDIRKIVWEGAWKLALKYPIFGTGVETFAYSYNLVRPLTHNLTSEWDYVYNKAHNEYFNYLATTGFVGVLSYLLLIFWFIIYLLKKLRITNYELENRKSVIRNSSSNNNQIIYVGLIIAWLTILITNFFGFSTTTIQLFFYLIPALVVAGNYQETDEVKFEKVNTYQWLVIFVLIAVTVYLLFSIAIYYLADVNYSYGLKYSKVNDQQ
ncbi:MAG: O-antigen ligase family protein, partial [Patescibacteria group bacterium]